MDLYHLLQLAILVMAAVAAPIYPTDRAHTENATHVSDLRQRVEPHRILRPRPNAPDAGTSSKRPKLLLPASEQPASHDHDYDLFALLDNIDTSSHITMAKPAATGTNNLSDKGASHLPQSIKLTMGDFDPDAILNDYRPLLVDPDTYRRAQTIFDAAKWSKGFVKVPISGEGGLSHMLYQQFGGIVNQILEAIGGNSGAWSIRARGAAPIEDWQYVITDTTASNAQAVLELKTPDSLPRATVDTIIDMVEENRFEMKMKVNKGGTVVNSLVDGQDKKPSRDTRKPEVRAMEQVIAQMYATKARIGVLTNGERDYFVLEKLSSVWAPEVRGDIRVSYVRGMTLEGQNNIAKILIAVSLVAKSLAFKST